jgi:hypothetical protein
MPYKINHLEEENIIETVYRNKVKLIDVSIVFQKNLLLAKKHRINLFLVDCTEMVDTKSMVVENYEAGILFRQLIKQIPKRVKNAIILSHHQLARENLLFFEMVTRNRGVNVRTFENREDALSWLLQRDTEPL